MEGTSTGREDVRDQLREARKLKKAGRRCTGISVLCTAEELPSKIDELKSKGFELDDDWNTYETVNNQGSLQHLVVLHAHEKLNELQALPGVTLETRF